MKKFIAIFCLVGVVLVTIGCGSKTSIQASKYEELEPNDIIDEIEKEFDDAAEGLTERTEEVVKDASKFDEIHEENVTKTKELYSKINEILRILYRKMADEEIEKSKRAGYMVGCIFTISNGGVHYFSSFTDAYRDLFNVVPGGEYFEKYAELATICEDENQKLNEKNTAIGDAFDAGNFDVDAVLDEYEKSGQNLDENGQK